MTDHPSENHSLSTLQFNPKDYQHHLSGFDLDEDQQKELLESLFQIAVSFVDLGLGIHPLQNLCGKFLKESQDQTLKVQNPLYYSHAILDDQVASTMKAHRTDSSEDEGDS